MTSKRPHSRIARVSDIGALIAEGRKRARLSQAEFAERLGVSRKTISDAERGAAENLSLSTALAALGLAGFQIEATPRRPPTLNEIMARRAADLARAEQTESPDEPRSKSHKD